ncbi:cysteine-rich receptor-like protein kinase 10 [Tasmannia lanceolata]|uniref:cysteine-rich receptor-like protein kinase 10 n=1 Tax=Tasmannia lanceolata TaxID=3420 RepID=UPI0040640A88
MARTSARVDLVDSDDEGDKEEVFLDLNATPLPTVSLSRAEGSVESDVAEASTTFPPGQAVEVAACEWLEFLHPITVLSSSPRNFATGQSSSSLQRIYGLVQCTPDLSGNECSRCLESAIYEIPRSFDEKQGGRVIGPSCNFRYEMCPFFIASSHAVPEPAPLHPPDNTTNMGSKGSSSGTIIAIVVPLAVVVVVLAAICICVLRKKATTTTVHGNESIQFVQFSFTTIRAATDNFSEANKLGQGGFGVVFKGRLLDGYEIAVKRLSRNSRQGVEEFKNEIAVVARLQHKNLVRLFGCCLEGEEKILVYEYVPNKSLDYFLFDPTKRAQLDWQKRYKIIEMIAQGLLYLHEESRLRIIHRDLKAGNVLLDREMQAKISDFGMAKIFGVDQTHGNTNRIAGTYGYMAPEYARRGVFSVKSDIFSFGVLILEIVSGKKNTGLYHSEHAESLLTYAWRLWFECKSQELIDASLIDTCTVSEALRCIHIGLLCAQEDPAERPTIPSVILMLGSESLGLPQPKQPAFCVGREGSVRHQSSQSSKTCSINEVTISSVVAR